MHLCSLCTRYEVFHRPRRKILCPVHNHIHEYVAAQHQSKCPVVVCHQPSHLLVLFLEVKKSLCLHHYKEPAQLEITLTFMNTPVLSLQTKGHFHCASHSNNNMVLFTVNSTCSVPLAMTKSHQSKQVKHMDCVEHSQRVQKDGPIPNLFLDCKDRITTHSLGCLVFFGSHRDELSCLESIPPHE